MNISEEEIKKDRKCIKKLKISCEKIKRVLSVSDETTLLIKDFYKNNDILEVITKRKKWRRRTRGWTGSRTGKW